MNTKNLNIELCPQCGKQLIDTSTFNKKGKRMICEGRRDKSCDFKITKNEMAKRLIKDHNISQQHPRRKTNFRRRKQRKLNRICKEFKIIKWHKMT